MKLTPTAIKDLMIAQTTPFTDHRGAFARFFCAGELGSALGERRIVQINHSRTETIGAVRGLHYQNAPHTEMKMVRCLKGRVLDVAVDLRPQSPTFLKWHAEELSPEAATMLVIPEGFAHGFQVLEAGSELLYLHTASYDKGAEGGVRFDDPALGIRWPLPVTDLSDRDRNHPLITADFQGIRL